MYHDLWYALPLIIAVSLVYAATRSEAMPQILHGALRVAIWFGGFVAVVMVILYAIAVWA
jgi:hypothetical protein